MIENHIPISSDLIDSAGFAVEKINWCTTFIFTGIISSPIDVSEALHELQESMNCNIWWGEDDLKVRLKAFAPPSPGTTSKLWTDGTNLSKVDIDYNEKSRVSEAIVRYDKMVLDDADKDDSYDLFASKKDSE